VPENLVGDRPASSTSTTAKRNQKSDFQQAWKQYAAAAFGVAGASALASAQTPGQHILYTPADIAIDTHSSRQVFIPIDFNHDGVADLYLIASHFTDFFSGGLGFAAYGRITASVGGGNLAITSHALPKGMIIDKGGVFKSGQHSIAYAGSGSYMGVKRASTAQGPFVRVKNKYLGVRFLINGQTHEGWVRLTLAPKGADISGAITGYAFDTVPNEFGLAAGQLGGRVGPEKLPAASAVEDAATGSLGMLAAGSAAIPYWRK